MEAHQNNQDSNQSSTESAASTNGAEQAPSAASTESSALGSSGVDAQPAAGTEVERLQQELAAEKNKYLYLYAEFENYKKRTIKERSDLIKFGSESLMRELVQVKDNLERALSYTDNLDALVTGLRMVDGDLKKALEKFGLKEVLSMGEKFDPTLHEAVGQDPTAENGVICHTHQKGYVLHGRLVRPSQVVIGSKQV